MDKLLFSLVLVVVGVCTGYLFQQLVNNDIIPLKSGLNPLKKQIQRVTFLLLNPVTIVGATWVAKLEDITLLALPVLCLVNLGLGCLIAYFLAKMFGMTRRQTGAYLGCGSFTNIGALGALFCYMFLGEAGFALVPIYKLFEEFTYFAYIFPLTKSFSIDKTIEKTSAWTRLKVVFSDVFVMISVASIMLGLILNLTKVPRPPAYEFVNAVLIPLIVFLLLFTIGMGMRFSNIKGRLIPALSLTAAKYCVIPIIVAGLGMSVGLHHVDNGLPFKVVLILSAMPVGFMSVIPPTLYDLDLDLANTCWLVSNSLLLIQVPLLLYIVTNVNF